MRRQIVALAAIGALLFLSGAASSCNSDHGNRPSNIVHSDNPDPPRGAWKDFADVVRSVVHVCEVFRNNTDARLSTPTNQAEVTQFTSRDGVPAALVNLVGEYYRGNLDPAKADDATALKIRHNRIGAWCTANHV